MKKVVWQTKSPVVYNSFDQGKLSGIAKGGNSYNFYAAHALAEHFNFSIDRNSVKKSGEPNMSYYLRLSVLRPKADVVIKEGYPAALSPVSKSNVNVAIIHHIDELLGKSSFRHSWFYDKLIKKLPQMDLVITVSKYWETHLKNMGCSNVKVIYNSFDPEEFKIDAEAAAAFKAKYKFGQKPLIYIGNAHRQKGVYEAYEALKGCGYDLVMTGSKNEAADLPVNFLSLNRKEYLALLQAANAVVVMSNMPEGWNRVAHEAMLSGTPVIGSGAGGMQELLEEGGQAIALNADDLRKQLEGLLHTHDAAIKKGYAFASRFNKSYFDKEWVKTIQHVITNKVK